MDAHDRDRVPEESVEPILARAAELDRKKRETVSVDVLRSAALEAGISVDAVDRAVEEYTAGVESAARGQGPLEPHVDQPATWRKATGALAVAALAASGAAVAANAHTPGIALAAAGAALLAGLAVSSFRRHPPSE